MGKRGARVARPVHGLSNTIQRAIIINVVTTAITNLPIGKDALHTEGVFLFITAGLCGIIRDDAKGGAVDVSNGGTKKME